MQFVIMVFPDHTRLLLAESEDQDEMPHGAAFHLGLHYLQKKNNFQRKKCIFLLFLNLKRVTHRNIQWTIPGLLYQTIRKNPLENIELNKASSHGFAHMFLFSFNPINMQTSVPQNIVSWFHHQAVIQIVCCSATSIPRFAF